MGWLGVLLGAIASYLFFSKDQFILLIVALIITVLCFWSWGIMHNYATNAAKKRNNYSGNFFDITDEEASIVPDWITFINIISTVGNLLLLIVSLII